MDTYQPGALTPNSTTYRGRDYGISDRAFPSLALIEAAGGITSPDVHEFAKKAAEGLLAARLDDGGWCRGRGKRTNYETYEVYLEEGSTTGTAMTVLALIRADELGLVELPEDLLRDAFLLIQGLWISDGSRAFLSADNPSPFTFYTETGQVYTRGDAGTSGALLLERLVMGAERKITKEGKKHLTSMVPNRKNNEATQDDALAWFLLNLALYPNTKTLAKKWAKGVETALDQFQASKGCAKGSWDFYCFRTRSWGGRVYSTSMAILCLQTPLWGEALFGE
jgi:hypothetical protein